MMRLLCFCCLVGAAMSDTETPPLTIVSIATTPWLDIDTNMTEGDNDRFSGYIKDVLDEIAKRQDFEYDLSLVRDGRYGTLGDNGEWSGMIGEVVAGRAHIAAAPLSITPLRADAVSFTKPFLDTSLAFLVGSAPTRQVLQGDDKGALPWLLRPFTFYVWVACLIVWLLVWIVMVIINRFSPYEWKGKSSRGRSSYGEAETYSPSNSAFSISSILFWQGYDRAPASVAGRILLVGWFLFVGCVAIVYTAGITVNLLARNTIVSSNGYFSVAEMLNSGVSFGTVRGGSTSRLLQRSQVSVRRDMYNMMVEGDWFVDTEEDGVLRVHVLPKDFVFIMEEHSAIYAANQPPCKLNVVGAGMRSYSYGFAVRRGDVELVSKLNSAISEMEVDYTLGMLYRRWFLQGDALQCGETVLMATGRNSGKDVGTAFMSERDEPKFSFYPVDGEYMLLPAFAVVAVAMIAALVAMVIEKLVHRKRSKQRADVTQEGEQLQEVPDEQKA